MSSNISVEIFMCNLPLHEFNESWRTYSAANELLSARTLRNYLATVREKIEINIQPAPKNRKL